MNAVSPILLDRWRREAIATINSGAEATPEQRRLAWAFLKQHGATPAPAPSCAGCDAWFACDPNRFNGYCQSGGKRQGWRTEATHSCEDFMASAAIDERRSPALAAIPCSAEA